MRCPTCNERSEVIDKNGAKRRRQCSNGHRFSTLETVVAGRQRKADAPHPAPPGGLLAAVWHSPNPNSADS